MFEDIVLVHVDAFGNRIYEAPRLSDLNEGDRVVVTIDGHETFGTVVMCNSYISRDSMEVQFLKKLINRNELARVVGVVKRFEYDGEDGTDNAE